MPVDPERRLRFEALFGRHHTAVRSYVVRRSAAIAVDDVVADTFLVAWRRLDDVPESALPCASDIQSSQGLQNIVPRRLQSFSYDRLAEPRKVDGYRPKPAFRQAVKVLAPHRAIGHTGVEEQDDLSGSSLVIWEHNGT